MPIHPLHHEQPKPRILQHNKKRYSLRLEEVFWSQLKSIAQREHKRPGALIAELDRNHKGPNLSSYVRSFCMNDLQRQQLQNSGSGKSINAMDAIKASPASALVLNEDGLIIDTNPALLKWLGDPLPPVINNHFTNLFIPRMSRSFADTLELMQTRNLKRTQMQVVYTRPRTNQKVSALATLVNLTPPGETGLICLSWFSVSPPYRLRVQ